MTKRRIDLDIPIACTLSDNAFQNRVQALTEVIKTDCLDIQPQDDGYRLQFAEKIAQQLLEIVHIERECCPFLKFELHFEPQNGPLWVYIRGPESTKQYLQSTLNL